MISSSKKSVIKQLHREIQELLKSPIDGVRVIPNESDIMSLEAVIDGPENTPYRDGQFAIRLTFGDEYPKLPPKGHFITTIFHPNVSASNGEICVNTLQKDWNPELGLGHLLLTIKCLLMVPNAESALNEEAGMMLLENYGGYIAKAQMMTCIHAKPDLDQPTISPTKRVVDDQNTKNQANAAATGTKETDGAKALLGTRESLPTGSVLAEMRKKLKRL